MQAIDLPGEAPLQILEVGPGTGYNSNWLLKHFPKASLTAFELSLDMILQVKRKTRWAADRVSLFNQAYGKRKGFTGKFDLVLFSYCLSMVNPQWIDLLKQAENDLKPGGNILVVDFHNSEKTWFRKYMARHHTRVEGQLLPALQSQFTEREQHIGKCYGSTWEYFYFWGEKVD